MIICVAGDPGGSRAVLPVAKALWQAGEKVAIPNHGTLGKEIPVEMGECLYDEKDSYIMASHCKGLIFGSSVKDDYPLALAVKAKSHGAIVMHILDNWSNYYKRLCFSSSSTAAIFPDLYLCIDSESKNEAKLDGIPPSSLIVSGQPALAEAADYLDELHNKYSGSPRNKYERLRLSFICEPFEMVFGKDCNINGHPGFTEKTVLANLCSALQPFAEQCELVLLPHPKQTHEEIKKLWSDVHGSLQGGVVSYSHGRQLFDNISGIAGMASILLYEAWLAGIPVLCIQPQCRIPALCRYGALDDINYVSDVKDISFNVDSWLSQCRKGWQESRPELNLHKVAPQKAADIFLKHVGEAN